jgi:hypothetical protein
LEGRCRRPSPAVLLENCGNDRNKVWPIALIDVVGRVLVPKMALLVYLVMVACLMTSVFVGYEWIATSSKPRVALYVPAHTKVINRTAKSKLAADRARLASASTGEAAREPDLTIVNSAAAPPAEAAKEELPSDRRTARVHRKPPKIIVQRTRDGTVLGYAEAPELRSIANVDHYTPW